MISPVSAKASLCTAAVSLALLSGSTAAVLQTSAADYTTNNAVIVDTSNDTGNWITTANAGGTYYFGFDFTVANIGTNSFDLAGLAFRDGTSNRNVIGFTATTAQFSHASNGGGVIERAGTIVLDTTYRLVARVTFNAATGTDDNLALFVDQATEGTPLLSTTNSTLTSFDNLIFREESNSEATLGNLIVATTYAEAAAVPEPSSTALLGLGGLALILRRRR